VKPKRPEDLAFLAELGWRVRLNRRYQDLTQDELGARAGLSRSFVGIFETGTHGIDVVSLRRVAQALGVPLPELVDERPPNDRHGRGSS
jgi:transcriptional regulator with XRE-family HTH domain